MRTTFATHKIRYMGITATILTLLGSQVSAQTFLTEKELLTTIPGATVYGVSNSDGKTKWIQNYSTGKRKGNIAGLWGGKDKYNAKWYVKNGQWCEKWNEGSACWHVERVKSKKLRMYHDGKPLKNLWRMK